MEIGLNDCDVGRCRDRSRVESRRRVYFESGLSAHILCKVAACAWTTTTTRSLSQVRSRDRIASRRRATEGHFQIASLHAHRLSRLPARCCAQALLSARGRRARRSMLLDLLMRVSFFTGSSRRDMRVPPPHRAAGGRRHSRVTFFFCYSRIVSTTDEDNSESINRLAAGRRRA